MTLPTTPEWLKKRDGSLAANFTDHSVFVILGGQPQYRLDVRPAKGQFTCNVTQTNNGHRLDGDAKYASQTAAFDGGLENLRGKLGW